MFRVLPSLVTLSMLLGASACLVEEPPIEVGTVNSEIVNGVSNIQDPAVVALFTAFDNGYGGLCTGTVVGKRSILTAAHCVDELADSTVTQYYAYFGSRVFDQQNDPAYLDKIDIVAYDYNRAFNRNDLYGGNDVAMVLLARDAPVAPIPLNRTPATQLVGQTIKLTGFGITLGGREDSGIKRQVETQVGDYSTQLLFFGDSTGNTCSGDSGGPQLITSGGQQYVASVTSFGDQNCVQLGAGTRVDQHLNFIEGFIVENEGQAAVGTCQADGTCATGCDSPDPDCPCAADGLCTNDCPDTDTDPDCPAG